MSCKSLEFLGMIIDNWYFIDCCLPFGSASSCIIFELIASFLDWYMQQLVQEDFLFCHLLKQHCQFMLDQFRLTCSKLNFPLAESKTEGPSQQLVFLGTGLDTVLWILTVPEDKVLQAQEKIKFILRSKLVYIQEIQALTGLLNFITRVVRPGRAFLRHLYDSIANQNPKHHVNVTASMKKDLRAWMSFLTDFECYRPFPSKYTDDSDSLHFYTDSTAKVGLGFGCYFDGEWTFGQWPVNSSTRNPV